MEDIAWVARFMSGNSAIEFLLAYVALSAYQYLIDPGGKKRPNC